VLSKEDLTPIPVTQYIHLQVVSHHDRPSLLPLDNAAFSHHPCTSACDAQRTSTIWASLSPLCEALILDYLSRNCPLPQQAKWQLHSAWPVTQQLSRRGRYLQRALLGSQLLSWQGNFVVVFSALLPRAEDPGRQAEPTITDQPRKTIAAHSPKAVKPPDAGTHLTKPQPEQEQSNGAIGLVTRQPETTYRSEHASLQDKPTAHSQSVPPDRWLSQPRNPNMLQPNQQTHTSDHASWQLVQRQPSMYPPMPYGSTPYATPYIPSPPPTGQPYGPLANMYSSPAGYFQPDHVPPFTGYNPFSPYHTDHNFYEQQPTGMTHALPAMHGYPMPSSFGSTQLPPPPPPPPAPAIYGQGQAPTTYLPMAQDAAPPPPPPPFFKGEVDSQRRSAPPAPHARKSRYKSGDNASYSSSSGPESIYPLRTSTTSRPALPHINRRDSIPNHRYSTSSRTVTFSDNTMARPRIQTAETAESVKRRSDSRYAGSSDAWKAVHIPSSATRVPPTSRSHKTYSPDKSVASDDDDAHSETFDDMFSGYVGHGRPVTSWKASGRS
jgi:hypothetical protein